MKLDENEVILYRDEYCNCWRLELKGCGEFSINRDLPLFSTQELINIRDVLISTLGLPEVKV